MAQNKISIVGGLVQSDVKLNGKTVVITGANTGIGYETALDLAGRGARVIMACRDLQRARTAKDKILEQCSDAEVVVKKLDLASLKSVREFAKDITDNEARLDILVNNAAISLCPAWKTEDGFEMQIGVNHIGHFLLTNLLLDSLKKSSPSRIVIVSSSIYSRGKMNWDDMMYEKNFDTFSAYQISKLANMLHGIELSKKLKGTGVGCYMVHPGLVKSELGRHVEEGSHLPWYFRYGFRLFSPLIRLMVTTTQKGAQTSIYCAIAPELEGVSGKYYVNCSEVALQNYDQLQTDAERLWEISEEWTKE